MAHGVRNIAVLAIPGWVCFVWGFRQLAIRSLLTEVQIQRKV